MLGARAVRPMKLFLLRAVDSSPVCFFLYVDMSERMHVVRDIVLIAASVFPYSFQITSICARYGEGASVRAFSINYKKASGAYLDDVT